MAKLAHVIQYLKTGAGATQPLVVREGSLDDIAPKDNVDLWLFGYSNNKVAGIRMDAPGPEYFIEFDVNNYGPDHYHVQGPHLQQCDYAPFNAIMITEGRIFVPTENVSVSLDREERDLVQKAFNTWEIANSECPEVQRETAAEQRYLLTKKIKRQLQTHLNYSQADKIGDALMDCKLSEFDTHLEKVIETLINVQQLHKESKDGE